MGRKTESREKMHFVFIIIAILFIFYLCRVGIEDKVDVIMIILALVMLAINFEAML